MTRTIRTSFAFAAVTCLLQACTLSVPGLSVPHTDASKTATGTTTGATGNGTLVTEHGNSQAPTSRASAAPSSTGADLGGIVASDPGGNLVADAPSAGVSAGQSGSAIAMPARPAIPAQQQTSLKAGAIDDNADLDAFLSYQRAYTGEALRDYDVSERHVIVVKDAAGRPVPNAKVTVAAGEKVVFSGKTYANGKLLFHPKAVNGADVGSRFFVTVGDDTTKSTGFARTATGDWNLTWADAPAAARPKLDFQIVLDTTGSMGGEISKLQATLAGIASRINALPQAPEVRFGLVAFKDRQESGYLTKKKDFTGSITDFQTFLNTLTAAGGGDIPEDDESAIADALSAQQWDANAAARLSFLITDAPPHVDYDQSTSYTSSIAKAQAMGVKFYTIGASGLPADGEYFLRQLAQATMGQYLFITRGGDEYKGGGEVSATVDKFQEGKLDDIMVDLVKAELSGLGTNQAILDPMPIDVAQTNAQD